jgi:hypothetical protein
MEPGKRDEQDYNVSAYEIALGAKKDAVEAMERGASAREAAERYNLPRAAVTALKAGSENAISEPSHNLETGEITESETPAPQGLSFPRTPEAAGASPPVVTLDLDGGERSSTHSDDDMPDQPPFLRRGAA